MSLAEIRRRQSLAFVGFLYITWIFVIAGFIETGFLCVALVVLELRRPGCCAVDLDGLEPGDPLVSVSQGLGLKTRAITAGIS